MIKEKELPFSTDARKWAKEFCKLKNPDQESCETWFANAIMAGWDAHAALSKPPKMETIFWGIVVGCAAIALIFTFLLAGFGIYRMLT